MPFNKGKASNADKEIPSDYTKSKKRSAQNQSTKPTQRKAKKRTGKSDPNKDSAPGSSTLQDDEEENVLDYEEEEELEEEMTLMVLL